MVAAAAGGLYFYADAGCDGIEYRAAADGGGFAAVAAEYAVGGDFLCADAGVVYADERLSDRPLRHEEGVFRFDGVVRAGFADVRGGTEPAAAGVRQGGAGDGRGDDGACAEADYPARLR